MFWLNWAAACWSHDINGLMVADLKLPIIVDPFRVGEATVDEKRE